MANKEIKVDLFSISKDRDKFNFFRYMIENKGGNIFLLDRIAKVYRRILDLGEGTLMRGTMKKEEADFFFFPKKGNEIIRLSFFFPEGGVGGIRLDSYSFNIPLSLENSDFDCIKSSICIASKNEKEYIMIDKEKDTLYRGKIKVDNYLKVKSFGVDKSFILTDEGIYIVLEGKRGYISKESIPFPILEIESWGIKKENSLEYLALSTKNKVILISLNKENPFYFGIFDKNPFPMDLLE